MDADLTMGVKERVREEIIYRGALLLNNTLIYSKSLKILVSKGQFMKNHQGSCDLLHTYIEGK